MIINPLIIIPSQLNELGEPKRQLADVNGHSMVVQSYKQIKQAGIGSIIVDCIDDNVAEVLEDAGAYTNATDVPYRFVPCMVAGLTFYLSQKYAPQRTQEMKLLYEDELARALSEDGSPASTYITPKTYYPNI